MGEFIRATGKIISSTARDTKNLTTEPHILEVIPTANPKAMGHMSGITEKLMKGSGLMARSTVLAFGEDPMEILILDSGNRGKPMAMGSILGLTATDMKVSF